MPRPSKRVSPDTLGGVIRSARQNLHLSLAEVAGEKYSTSLISQIEHNRIDASEESMKYLTERLKLPFDNMMLIAKKDLVTGFAADKLTTLYEKRAHVS